MRKMGWILGGIVLFYMILPMQAQEKHNIKLGFSVGIDGISGPDRKIPQVREYPKSYYDDFFYSGVASDQKWITIKHAGIDAEYFVFGNRFGLSGGLQLSQYSSKLESFSNYFFWELGKNGLTTDYLRIQNIKQDSYYLGIPLGFRYLFRKQEKPFQFYTKIGANFDFRVKTDNEITFQDKAMDKYAGSVENQLRTPSFFSAYVYPAVGFKLGKFKAGTMLPWVNLEFRIPGFMLNSNASSFVKSVGGLGFHFAVQIPLGNNVPIGSK